MDIIRGILKVNIFVTRNDVVLLVKKFSVFVKQTMLTFIRNDLVLLVKKFSVFVKHTMFIFCLKK